MNKPWECRVEPDSFPDPKVVNSEGQPVGGLTVGRKFRMSCEGETGTLRSDLLRFESDKKNDYRLKIIEVSKFGEYESEFILTSYVAGDHRIKGMKITDGLAAYELKEFPLQVVSVMDPQKRPEKPLGPLGPLGLAMPWYYYGVWIGLALALLAVAGLSFYRRYQKKRLIEQLKQHNTALGAFHQLQKDLRAIQRQKSLEKEKTTELVQQSLRESQEIFKMYLVRELLIPANEWSVGLIFNAVRKQHPRVFRRVGRRMKSLLIELEKATEEGAKTTETDYTQLLGQIRSTAEQIHRSVRS